MAYTQLDFISPNYIEHEFHYAGNYGAKGEKREPKEKATPLQIEKQNQWNRIKRLRRVLQLNFFPGDYWITVKYKAGTRKDIIQVKADVKKFLDGLRKKYKARGQPLMFVYRLEIGKRGGLHCHMVINRIPDADLLMRECWKKATDDAGSIDYTTLEESGGFAGLAEYICKQPGEEIQGQMRFLIPDDRKKLISISTSRNLKRPSPEIHKRTHWTMRHLITEGPKPREGFYIDRDSIRQGVNRVTGMSYFYYTEVRIDQIRSRDGQDRLICPYGHKDNKKVCGLLHLHP